MLEVNSQGVESVAFIVAGIGLDIEGISRTLKLEPSHTHRAGEPNMIGKLFPHDMWRLETSLSEVDSLDAHLKWLQERLNPYYDFIQSLKTNAEISIYCGINCDSDQCGFSLTPEALSIFTELGIKMEVTVLFDSEDSP
jgi:hypothetical protein